MRRLRSAEVQAQSVAALGLDATTHALTSSTSIAAALRRSASFLCPCAGSTLVRSVLSPLRGLVEDHAATKTMIEDTLEQLIAHGDLFEYRDPTTSAGTAATILYAAPCGFVPRTSGSVILLGVSADQSSALPDELEARVVHSGHIRRLMPLSAENLRDDLAQLGLIEIPYDRWLKEPATESPTQHVSRLDDRLQRAQPSGEIPELMLLDPEKPVRFYPARWVEPKKQTGRFVARRKQAYGAPVWCYVQLSGGHPQRFVDFPSAGSRWRGCDEAWRLQMAIDAVRQNPQRFSVRQSRPGMQSLELFSPVPMWAQRRWDAVGQRAKPAGCLLAFEFPEAETAEEIRYAREALWLDAVQGSPQSG